MLRILRGFLLFGVTIVAAACGVNDADRAVNEYVDAINPILESHAVLTESTNQLNVTAARAVSSGDRVRIVTALENYRDKLDMVVIQIRRELVELRALNAPAEVAELHRKLIEGLLLEAEAQQDSSVWYSNVLGGGNPDDRILDRANDQLREATLMWVDAKQLLLRIQDD
ncbi:hypothetical protein FIL92_00625 [SAR202 cluster bacterium AD-812-D07_MRT_10900m]|nr:hypothetical protein [SAR202 cluster bacterium AD-812-D07_MRT_10900m]